MEQAAVATQDDARSGYFFEDLAIGMSAEFSRVINDEEMRLFADLTGDDNPLHFSTTTTSPGARASAGGSCTACAPQH